VLNFKINTPIFYIIGCMIILEEHPLARMNSNAARPNFKGLRQLQLLLLEDFTQAIPSDAPGFGVP